MLSPALKAFHDKVYVLTTRGATERQRRVNEELGEGNFEFVFGVDRHDATIDEFVTNGIYDPTSETPVDGRDHGMNIGEICCSIGHKMVYEKFLESNGERALIFEDDLVSHDVKEDDIKAALRHVPPDAEIIYWGWWFGTLRPRSRIAQQMVDHLRSIFGLSPESRGQIRNRYMRRYNRFFHRSARNFFLHSYTLTRSGAQTMMKMNTPIVMPADHVPVKAIECGRMSGYVAIDQLFWQRSRERSDPEVSMILE